MQPRKTPAQSRSKETVEAIFEATIQVLLGAGLNRLTTTRVAARAGVSVGTLYQYFPNKQALLFALLERHMNYVAEAVEQVCARLYECPLAAMVEGLVGAYVDAKLRRADIARALYRIAVELDGTSLVADTQRRSRAAITAMLATAPDVHIEMPEVKAAMLSSAMAGATRALLEAGTFPAGEQRLRLELVLLGRGYLRAGS